MLRDAPLSPFESSVHRHLLIVAGVHQRGALVEREDDVGPEGMLHLHRDFGREPVARPVEV